MTPQEAYQKLPIGTISVYSDFKWVKINCTRWRCIFAKKDGWKVGDIYVDFGDESINDGKYILPFDLYLKQAEQL